MKFEVPAVVKEKGYRDKVFKIVEQIPRGRVMTYGQIADILGEGYTPRTVGFVMNAADTENVAWQRVINSKGSCSTAKMTMPVNLQQKMLEDEGVVFNERGECDLKTYRYAPPAPVDENAPLLFEK